MNDSAKRAAKSRRDKREGYGAPKPWSFTHHPDGSERGNHPQVRDLEAEQEAGDPAAEQEEEEGS